MAYFLFCNFVIFAGLLVDATNTINECEYIIHDIKFNDELNHVFVIVVQDLMPEFSSMLLALLIGGYTIIGGNFSIIIQFNTNNLFLFKLNI